MTADKKAMAALVGMCGLALVAAGYLMGESLRARTGSIEKLAGWQERQYILDRRKVEARELAAAGSHSAAQAQWTIVYWKRREVSALEAVCGCGGACQ